MARRKWMTTFPILIPDKRFSFTDREHGRTAPPYLRKHCQGCGRTLPNRSRSWFCPECYPEYRAYVLMSCKQRRQAAAAIWEAVRGR